MKRNHGYFILRGNWEGFASIVGNRRSWLGVLLSSGWSGLVGDRIPLWLPHPVEQSSPEVRSFANFMVKTKFTGKRKKNRKRQYINVCGSIVSNSLTYPHLG